MDDKDLDFHFILFYFHFIYDSSFGPRDKRSL